MEFRDGGFARLHMIVDLFLTFQPYFVPVMLFKKFEALRHCQIGGRVACPGPLLLVDEA